MSYIYKIQLSYDVKKIFGQINKGSSKLASYILVIAFQKKDPTFLETKNL